MLFDAFGALKRYETVKEIVNEFFKIRLELYTKRKEFLQGILQAEADKLKEQARFILEKIDGTIVIGKVSPNVFNVSPFIEVITARQMRACKLDVTYPFQIT